jgi:hypothetical protein
MTVYDMLAGLAERELEVVTAGAMDDLPVIHSERDALLAKLPARPPASAGNALERAAVVQVRVTAALETRKRELAAELGRIDKGRTMLRGYRPPVEPQPSGIDQTG